MTFGFDALIASSLVPKKISGMQGALENGGLPDNSANLLLAA